MLIILGNLIANLIRFRFRLYLDILHGNLKQTLNLKQQLLSFKLDLVFSSDPILCELIFYVGELITPAVEVRLVELDSVHEFKSRGHSPLVEVLQVRDEFALGFLLF